VGRDELCRSGRTASELPVYAPLGYGFYATRTCRRFRLRSTRGSTTAYRMARPERSYSARAEPARGEAPQVAPAGRPANGSMTGARSLQRSASSASRASGPLPQGFGLLGLFVAQLRWAPLVHGRTEHNGPRTRHSGAGARATWSRSHSGASAGPTTTGRTAITRSADTAGPPAA
jgi:hypothetical protein